jgi:hypothetical protein
MLIIGRQTLSCLRFVHTYDESVLPRLLARPDLQVVLILNDLALKPLRSRIPPTVGLAVMLKGCELIGANGL